MTWICVEGGSGSCDLRRDGVETGIWKKERKTEEHMDEGGGVQYKVDRRK